jgi:hypothetical protein
MRDVDSKSERGRERQRERETNRQTDRENTQRKINYQPPVMSLGVDLNTASAWI